MEKAYLDTDRREYELTRHFSLAELNAFALMQLRETGTCEIELKESHFDQDYPGHYFRRIKAASLTIPAVVGPYGGVHAKLTLLSSAVRRDPTSAGDYPMGTDDPRFVRDLVPVQSIVTSAGQSDAGLFQLDLRSERLLPFEGAGVISRWRLELDPETNAFDTRTVTDVVLHINYTARDGGAVLARAAKESSIRNAETAPFKYHLLSMKQEAPEALEAMRSATGDAAVLIPGALRQRIGFVPRHLQRTFEAMSVVFVVKEALEGASPTDVVAKLHEDADDTTGSPMTSSNTLSLPSGGSLPIAPHVVAEGEADESLLYDSSAWRLSIEHAELEAFLETISDVVLIVREKVSAADD